jgi:hypothetical protein
VPEDTERLRAVALCAWFWRPSQVTLYTQTVAQWAPFDMEIRRFTDRTYGILAEFTGSLIIGGPPHRSEDTLEYTTEPGSGSGRLERLRGLA